MNDETDCDDDGVGTQNDLVVRGGGDEGIQNAQVLAVVATDDESAVGTHGGTRRVEMALVTHDHTRRRDSRHGVHDAVVDDDLWRDDGRRRNHAVARDDDP